MKKKSPTDYGITSIDFITKYSAGTRADIEDTPFDLEAKDFLRFARSDLETKEKKSYVNALSNVKRAIENRADHVLYVFGFSSLNWKFPKKVEKLNELGIIAPKILEKINKIRNLLEHKYSLPKKEKIEDAIDVVTLFLESTEKFIKNPYSDFGWAYENENEIFVRMEFINKYKIEITVEISSKKENFSLNSKNPIFNDWLRFLIKNFP